MADTLNERFSALPVTSITATVAGAGYNPGLSVKYIWIQSPATNTVPISFGPTGTVFATGFQVTPGYTLGPIPIINRDASATFLVFAVAAATAPVLILEGRN